MGCFVRGGKNGMGCYVRGDINGMGCFVPGCFVRLPVLASLRISGRCVGMMSFNVSMN